MKIVFALLAIIAVMAIASAGRDADAMPWIQGKWLATYPDVCGPLIAAAYNCSLCHDVLPDGRPSGLNKHGNQYASAIVAHGYDMKAVEPLDSDRDGRTNGQEILHDCTLPGDPRSSISVPAATVSWSVIKANYR